MTKTTKGRRRITFTFEEAGAVTLGDVVDFVDLIPIASTYFSKNIAQPNFTASGN